ncbi:hypothetical protein VTK73DRAFT_10192 [Phialemonium thermophilum]|uniref:Uncharacterized protein n=1 Tax=Phialemonium thermophilum TaxID=223376 RepID=A0ABR3XI22_9PEZI
MAPRRPETKKDKAKAKARQAALLARKAAGGSNSVDPKQLLAEATSKLESGDAPAAARLAKRAYEHVDELDGGRRAGAVLTLLGEIHVEMGEVDEARAYFLQAVQAAPDDGPEPLPDDVGGGAEKFLWLAQLSEEGGKDSVSWFERGAAVLRAQIGKLSEALESASSTILSSSSSSARTAANAALEEKKRKLAETLCAVAEVYMTDLSWEADAEQRCEALVTEAGLLAPDDAETWQTLANVRISQARPADARAALERSLSLWTQLPPEHPAVPAFPTRVGLARLLMEVEMEERALDVVERLVLEDDQSVEAWYLGGYALYTLGEKRKEKEKAGGEQQKKEQEEADSDVGDWRTNWKLARQWLTQCLTLFQVQEYEDVRLGEHTKELLEAIRAELGDAADEDDDGDWEDAEDDDDEQDGDEEMQ